MNTNGLSSKEAIENRKKYGTNEIIKQNKNNFVSLLIESLSDPIIKILLIALTIKIVFLFKDFDWFETLGILIAIFLSSFISTISEYGSEKAFDKLLLESSNIKSKVKRDYKVKEIGINDVVVNDVVVLQQGDIIPADGILLEGNLSINESSLNGESKEVKKSIKESENKLYRGTVVYEGYGLMKVNKVGLDTFYGKIASELSEKKEESPLKLRLRRLAKTISYFGYVGAFLVSFSYLFLNIVINNNYNISLIISTLTNFSLMADYVIYALTLCVTIIIVSVPEGLPMMITLVLSSNMKRMLKSNVLVRKLVGIETSGSINVLFTDKTGTLTNGKLKCTNIIDGDFNNYKCEEDLKNNNYLKILKTSMIVNNMSFYDEDKIIGGNQTDKSLLSFFKPCKYSVKKIKVHPFNSDNKYMITKIDDDKISNFIKGAPEKVLMHCKYYYDENGSKKVFTNKLKIKNEIEEKQKKGVRVLVLACSNYANEKLFKDLIFVGCVFIKDTLRKDAKKSVLRVKNSGINVIMITGDNKDTAFSIAKEVGIINSSNDIVITSEELNHMSDNEVKKIMKDLKVVARSLPQDKSRLVRISKDMNLVVGMTGDGVNDAPALKKADVGFAFGSGSDVAKEASDIIILDNNFKSITNAILYGRTIFKSIRKFIIFQLTVNLCALSISIIGPFINIQSPVTVIQMLWINMVMDTLAALAFAYEPPLDEYMDEKPKKKDENIINGYMYNEILITGLFTVLISILYLKLPFIKSIYSSHESFMTSFFGLFIFLSIFNCFNAHTSRINVLSNLFKNKMFIIIISFIIIIQIIMIYYGGTLFRTIPLNKIEFLFMLLVSCLVIPFDMLRKIICKKLNKSFDV